jgi:hypothetical protein
MRSGNGITLQEVPHVSQPVNVPQVPVGPGVMAQQVPSFDVVEESTSEEMDIGDLALDINSSMPTEMDYDSEYASGSLSSTYLSFIPEMLREPLLIFIIFFILSQDVVQEKIGQFVPQTNLNLTGNSRVVSVVIYGLLLVTLYAISKKLLL